MLNKEKYIVKLNNNTDTNLVFRLTSGSNYDVDSKENINNLLLNKQSENINQPNDIEKLRYRPLTTSYINYLFFNGSDYGNDFTYAGFTTNEIVNGEDVFTESFYVIQVYDNFDSEQQTLLHTSFVHNNDFIIPKITNSIENEFSSIYISRDILNQYNDTFILYFRYYFYNAKFGKMLPFHYTSDVIVTTEDQIYYPVSFNKINRTYQMIDIDVKQFQNSDYLDKINEKIESIPLITPNYPDKTIFNIDGTYD